MEFDMTVLKYKFIKLIDTVKVPSYPFYPYGKDYKWSPTNHSLLLSFNRNLVCAWNLTAQDQDHVAMPLQSYGMCM